MRVLIDTNIFVYMATDPDYLSRDVLSLLHEPDTLIYISAESVRELVVAYRNKGLCSKRWKSAEEMVAAIEDEFYVKNRYIDRNKLEISNLRAFLKERGNDLATVANSAIYVAFLSVKQLLLCKGSIIYPMKSTMSV